MSDSLLPKKRKKPETEESIEGSNPKKQRKGKELVSSEEKVEAAASSNGAAKDGKAGLTKKQRKKLERGEGTREELLQYYGEDATASFELKLKEYFVHGKHTLKIQDIQSLILWVVGEAVAPKWFFIKNKPLVHKVVLVVVDGLTLPAINKYKTGLPSLASLYTAHPTPVPLQVNTSMWQPSVALESYFQCSRAKVKGKQGQKEKEKARAKAKAKQQAEAQSNASVEEGERNARVEEKEGEEEEEEGDFRPRAEYYVMTLEELKANDYPLDTAGFEETRPPSKKKQKEKGKGKGKGPRMVALDCEMVITEQGMDLARMTLVGQDGERLYDELVRPSRPITDYNTRFSGIDEKKMRDVTTTAEDARAAFHKYVDAETILVGHSMENDLKSLGVIHKRIIDTSLLYPHPRGPPAKRALRMLAKDFLGRTIQNHESGHDSFEDATAALDLVKLKIDKGPEFGVGPSATDNLFRVLSRARKNLYLIAAPDIAQRLTAGNVNAVPCASDSQAVDKACSAIGQSTDFVVVHLSGILPALPAQPEDKTSSSSSSSSEGAASTSSSTSAPAPALSSRLSALDAHLAQLHKACPRNSIIAVVTGQPNTAALRALHSRRIKAMQSNKRDTMWTAADEMQLKKETAEAQKGCCFFAMRT